MRFPLHLRSFARLIATLVVLFAATGGQLPAQARYDDTDPRGFALARSVDMLVASTPEKQEAIIQALFRMAELNGFVSTGLKPKVLEKDSRGHRDGGADRRRGRILDHPARSKGLASRHLEREKRTGQHRPHVLLALQARRRGPDEQHPLDADCDQRRRQTGSDRGQDRRGLRASVRWRDRSRPYRQHPQYPRGARAARRRARRARRARGSRADRRPAVRHRHPGRRRGRRAGGRADADALVGAAGPG